MNTKDTPSNPIDRREFLAQGGAIAALGGLAASAADAQEKKPLRVAAVSGWHAHAKGYARALMSMPDVKVTAVWDELPDRGTAWSKELDVPFVPNYDDVLKREDVDAICCSAPSNMHADLMTAAANAGKHIFTEKVMALTLDECDRIIASVKKSGVKFCISFPYRTRPETLYAKQAVDQGLLGKLTSIRVRVAHDGGVVHEDGKPAWLPEHFWDPVQCGGGAMMDLGAHPMYLARWLGGRPVKVTSNFTSLTDHKVEDNAISLIEFENKCIAVAETSFVSTFSPFSLELSGTEGSLIVGGGARESELKIRSKKLPKNEWQTPETLPEGLPSTIQIWVEGIQQNKPIPFGVEEGRQLTELMQYAYQSYREGKAVEIPKSA
jgi:1,5-anhydro-D-fructose reductase (1,5-anhydro-D-mannitol-forming)